MAEAATDTSEQQSLSLSVLHHGKTHYYTFEPDCVLGDLATAIEEHLSISPSYQKFLITPKVGLLKPPYPDPSLLLSTLTAKKIQLLAPLPSDIASLKAPPPRPRSIIKAAKPSQYRDPRKAHDDALYTFHTLIPLAYLPHPERSLKYLERLRDDPGIKTAMAKHKFNVGVLTEMNPAEHTTHESKTLGLNRNGGEVIELRLRTDAYDGYRDYKTIRETLCHELAHNVHSEHDRKFWDLTGQIEKEVERGDWTRGGRSLGEEEFYNPHDGGVGQHVDGGGWTGGEFVLGGAKAGGGGGSGGSASGSAGLSRRELMAKAAEERVRQQKEVQSRPEEDRTRQ